MTEPEGTLRILLQKAKNLRAEVDKVDPDPQTGRRIGSGLSAFTEPFNSLLQNVRSAFSGDAEALRQLSTLKELDKLIESLDPTYHTIRKHELLMGCRDIEAVLENRLSSSVEVPSMKVIVDPDF